RKEAGDAGRADGPPDRGPAARLGKNRIDGGIHSAKRSVGRHVGRSNPAPAAFVFASIAAGRECRHRMFPLTLALTTLCENPRRRTGLSTLWPEWVRAARRLYPHVHWLVFAPPES